MDAFAALADPTRRALLTRMAAGPARVVDLASEHQASRPAISKHLRLLADAGLVDVEDRGRERHYRLDRSGLRPVHDLLGALVGSRAFSEHDLDGLEPEVRRVGRDRRAEPRRQEETA